MALTREAIDRAVLPANNCAVKRFRDSMPDDEQRANLDYALSFDSRTLSAPRLRAELVKAGYPEADVPCDDAIQAHRNGKSPCRCRV